MFTVGKCRLQHHLDKTGITQQFIAERLGKKKQQINRYATGERKMPIDIAYNIALIVGCSIEDLYEWVVKDNE